MGGAPARQRAVLPVAQKPLQQVKQNKETKKYVPLKEWDKNLRGEINETEVNNLSDKEFKVVVGHQVELGREVDTHSKNFNKMWKI